MNKGLVIPAGSLVVLHVEDAPSIATYTYIATEKHARDGYRVESCGKVYRLTNLATGEVSYVEEV